MKVAITGTIGSGKSTVVSYIRSKGFFVFDCDEYAHQLLEDSEVINEVTSLFDCLEDGVISRKKLGEIVFNDKVKLEHLNAIIHPRVKAAIDLLDGDVFVDIPLLFEAKMENDFDYIICVIASEDIIINRLINRDHMSVDEAKKRISLQIDENIKKNKSDYVIINDRDKDYLYKQIDTLLGGNLCLITVQNIK